MKQAITNFKAPVSGDKLSMPELLITLAFILKGNYNPGNKSYICFSRSRNRYKSMEAIAQASKDLGIREYNVKDDNHCNVYYGGQALKLLMAKQGLIPSRFRWKQALHVPSSWIGAIPNDTLEKLLKFTVDLLENRDAFVKESPSCQIYDSVELHDSIIQFFKPIRPNIKIEYIEDLKCACIQGLSVDEPQTDTDDFSDLM